MYRKCLISRKIRDFLALLVQMAGTDAKREATSTDEVDMLPNLQKTSHGYIYRKTVPADLRGVIGKTVIK
jgi:hypothetical protein